jgi:AmiR/NasT family two-component response regulator
MKNCEVFVIWTNPLFLESIRALLKNPEIQLVGAGSNFSQAQKEISALQPNVVIIESSSDGPPTDYETLPILKSGSRVIQMSLDDNELNIFQHQHRTLAEAEDLLTMILEEGDLK